MPTLDRRRAHSHAGTWSRALLTLALLTLACGKDQLTQPRLRPPLQPDFDKHGNWGQRGRLVGATLVTTIDHSMVASTIRSAVAATIPRFGPSSIAALQTATANSRYDASPRYRAKTGGRSVLMDGTTSLALPRKHVASQRLLPQRCT